MSRSPSPERNRLGAPLDTSQAAGEDKQGNSHNGSLTNSSGDHPRISVPLSSGLGSASPVNPDDRHDIAQSLAGDAEAFSRIVVRYRDRLYHSLLHQLNSPEDAADAVQEAFINAFQKLGTFRGNSAFYSWLFRIAYNAAISQKRKERRGTVSLDHTRAVSGNEPIDSREGTQADDRLDRQEQQQLVRQALAEITEEFRVPLVLKEMDGMKYDEIADILDCPIGTVRSRIHRARCELKEKLRVLLGSNWPEFSE